MPRNKTAKRTNKRQAVKRQNMNSNVLVSMQKIENSFMITPNKLVAQLNKEINAQKKIEAKLKNAINKSKTLAKNAEMRVASLLKAKTTSASKKKLIKAKKIFGQASKSCNELENNLQAVTNLLTALLTQQAKLTSLSKHLSQFEKEWAKSSKKTSTKAKAKPAKPTKVKTKTKVASQAQEPQQAPVQADEITFDHIGFDEVTELAS